MKYEKCILKTNNVYDFWLPSLKLQVRVSANLRFGLIAIHMFGIEGGFQSCFRN